jgi:hypothetical protein
MAVAGSIDRQEFSLLIVLDNFVHEISLELMNSHLWSKLNLDFFLLARVHRKLLVRDDFDEIFFEVFQLIVSIEGNIYRSL